MGSIVIVNVIEGDSNWWEVRTGGEHLADADTLQGALDQAKPYATHHKIEHVKVQVKPERV